MSRKLLWTIGLGSFILLGLILAVGVEAIAPQLAYWGLSPLAYLGIGMVLYTLTRMLVAGMGGGKDGVGKR